MHLTTLDLLSLPSRRQTQATFRLTLLDFQFSGLKLDRACFCIEAILFISLVIIIVTGRTENVTISTGYYRYQTFC